MSGQVKFYKLSSKGTVQIYNLCGPGESIGNMAVFSEGDFRAYTAATTRSSSAMILFGGTIQGLVMQSLLPCYVSLIRHEGPRDFAIYQLGIRSPQ